ncbi:unnamed protein product [Ceratitis capitata]|uniref:(Mediterranean fruit fly) hypothetical protein n=1 Tax=Ceratitis capitata TaxID=7213 RepID=A0A811U4Y4_CERCA|nr:unnamed protein product [Ceratitis capitata]
MSKVNLFLLLTLTIATAVTANSCAVKVYKEKLLPKCDLQDIQIKWPNYEDQTSYYRCIAENSARLLSCPSGKVFVYVYQECRSCEDYIPAVECRNLRTQNTPICLPIDGGNNGGNGSENGGGNGGVVTYPTPRYPTQTTISDESTTSITESSEQPDDNSSTVEVPTTQPPAPPVSSSPSTESTDISQPSSPPPTPESSSQQPGDNASTVEVSTTDPSAPPSPDDLTSTPFPTPPSIG